jgi:FG-GAP-like repeat/FG-GAP repeat
MPFARLFRSHSRLLAALFTIPTFIAGCGGGGGAPPVTIQQNSVVVGDFNGDGRLDLAVAAARFSGAASLSGEVELFFQDPARPGFFFSPGLLAVGNDPSQLAAGDLNGDGVADLAVANTDSDSVSVILSNPARPGSFFPAVDYPCGAAPLAVAIGDLNSDGRADIAVAVADGVDLLFQNPAARGTFLLSSPPELAVTGGTFAVAIGDLDGDRLPDLAAAASSSVAVFFQEPGTPGTFAQAASFAAGLQPNGVAIADFDRDGLLDIAVANTGSSTDGSGASVSVLIQDPQTAGNFLPARNFGTPNGARNLAVGDLNGDGFPDIAVASVVFDSPNPGIISVFLQNSAAPGNFLFASTHPNGFTPQSVAIGDLDIDGRPDIAIQDGPSILFQDPLRPGTFFEETVVGP